MALYHRREQLRRGEVPTTYRYELDPRVRAQVVIILKRFYDEFTFVKSGAYPFLLEEFPEIMSGYPPGRGNEQFQDIISFFIKCPDDIALSVIEVMCDCLPGASFPINDRFNYERIGYQFNQDARQILKIEDERYYEECTEKTLGVLSQGKYQNALTHYINAYTNLARQRYNEALVDIGRAMESLLKTRFDEAGIEYSQKDTLDPLLTKAGAHIILPTAIKFEYVKQVILNAGRARNLGGHGHPDNSSHDIDDKFVRFVVNQGAANLLFLAEAEFKA